MIASVAVFADVVQLVEHDFAIVEVTSSRLVIRSNRRAPFDSGLVHREVMRTGRDRGTGYHRRSVDSDCRRLPLRGVGRRVFTCWIFAGIALWERARLSSEMRRIRFPLPAPMDRSTSGEVTTLSRWRGWVRIPHGLPLHCGHSSDGRARSFHVRCREFEARCPLHVNVLPL